MSRTTTGSFLPDGTLEGDATSASTNPVVGPYLQLDGNGDYVDISAPSMAGNFQLNQSPAATSISPLGDYGSPTQTMIPLPGSPTIDAATTSSLTEDQRGFAITDGSPDMGATEAPDWPSPTATELAWIFETDSDGDSNLYGMEILLGTDPFTHDLQPLDRQVPESLLL